MRSALTLVLLAVFALARGELGAQPPAPGVDAALDAARAEQGRALEISVLSFGNGEVLWERFGHNALVVTDTVSGRSLAYNWGVFDFDQPNFLANFLTGDTRYWLAVYPTDAMLAEYVDFDRSARRQVLALTDVQKAALAEYVNWNATGEARFYRYDYYLDNCSTRVRDAIDRALGGLLARELADVPAEPRTWREETARVTDGDWPAFAGIHVALGRNADDPLSRWNESFMPGLLADHLTTLRVSDGAGGTVPLVSHDSLIYVAQRAPVPERAPFRGFAALVIGCWLGGVVFFLGWRSERGGRAALIGLRSFATLWYLVGGVLGTALLLAGTVTKHATYMGSNGSLFQVHPLLLVLAVCAPFACGSGRAAVLAARLSMLAAALALLGLVLQMTLLSQGSGVVVAVTVPVHVALAGVLSRRLSGGRTAPVGPAALAAAA